MNKRICTILVAIVAVLASHAAFAQSQTYGPVAHGEDLWDIAHKVHPQADVTRDQVILALLKSNPLAVSVPCNANSVLRQGAVLTVPPIDQVRAIGAADAEREYARQIEEWKQYRESGQPIECPGPHQLPPVAAVETGQGVDVAAEGAPPPSEQQQQAALDMTAAEPAAGAIHDEANDVARAVEAPTVAPPASLEYSADAGTQKAASKVGESLPAASVSPKPAAENATKVTQAASLESSSRHRDEGLGAARGESSDAAHTTRVTTDAGHPRKTIAWAGLWNDDSLVYVVTMTLFVSVIFISGRLIRPT